MTTSPVRLLLIEDDQIDRLACRRALARQQERIFDIHETDSAHDGLASVRTEPPDLVLLDYRLPDRNGIEVLRELRAAQSAPPVIMLTGAGDIAVAVEAMRSGARDYIVKDTAGEYLALLPAVIDRVLHEQQILREKRLAEENLRLERDFISAVLATVGTAVVVLDSTGRIVRMNGAAEILCGYRSDEVCGRQVWDVVIPPEEVDAVKNVFYDLRAGVFPSRFENYWRHRDGSRRLLAWSNTALPGPDGAIEYVIATGLDITDRRAAEEQARRYQAEIERIYRQYSLGAFASVFAHELNQPLAAIVSYSDANLRLLRSGQDCTQIAHNIEQTALQAQRAAHIIRDIRRFLRAGTVEDSTEDINALVTRVVSQFAAEEAAHTVQFETACATLPAARVGRIVVEKVLLNLMQNALEALLDSPARGGRVIVCTSSDEPGFVRISVEDTGPGIEAADVSRLFQPFFTTKADGLGMGLAISRTIVEARGGRLWADIGQEGARFHFTVPAEP